MARTAKPWYLKKTDWWYVWFGGRRIKLAQGKTNGKAARDKLKELRLEASKNPSVDERQTVASVVEHYLRHARVGEETLAARKPYLQSFCDAAGWRFVDECKRIHLTQWLYSHTEWASDWTLNSVIHYIQRPFNWGRGRRHHFSKSL